MKVVLFPNMVEFVSMSMTRYADNLSQALHAVNANRWQIEDFECHHAELAAKVLPGKVGKKMADRLGRIVKYPRMASRVSGDVFHVLDHSHANLMLALDSRKSIITCHDCIPLLAARGEIPMKADGFKRYTFPLRLRCIERSARVITISESTKRDLLRFTRIPAERIDVVYYGVSPNFKPEPERGSREDERCEVRAKHGIPPDAKVMLHVSSPNRYKNTPALLHALAKLNAKPELKGKVWLLRVGAAFFEDEQALIDSLQIGGQIAHAGRVMGDTLLAPYYRAADVFVFPSLYEGFGWPPLEAMACGTPVVTSNVASLPEVVGDAGFMVDPLDHDGLTHALEQVVTNESLRLALQAKSLARAGMFTWERCAQKTLEVYERVAEQQRLAH